MAISRVAGSSVQSTANNTAAQGLQQQQVQQTAPVAPVNAGPTSFWSRIAQVGIGKVNQLELLAKSQNPVVRDTAGAVLKTGRVAKGLGEGIVNSAEALPKEVNKNLIQPLVHPTAVGTSASDIMTLQAKAQAAAKRGKISSATVKLLGQVNNPSAKIAAYKMIGTNSDQQIQQFLTKQQSAQTKQIKQSIGAGLNTASLVVGGGEAKGVVQAGKEAINAIKVAEDANMARKIAGTLVKTAKETTPIGVAGATGNVGSKLQANPNASGKELAKTAGEGYAGGVALGVAGKVAGKAIRGAKDIVFGKKASADVAKNVATNKLLQAGEEANKPKNIPVSDQSSGAVKGTVSSTLPKTKISIPVKDTSRPSDAGYTDTQFRLQFNKGAKEVVKGNPDTTAAYLKTGSKDPLTLTTHALVSTSSKSKIASAVDKLVPDMENKLKNQTVRDIQKAKDPQEVAHLLWDAAKNHEASITPKEITGTPMDKQISFKDSTPKETPSTAPAPRAVSQRLSQLDKIIQNAKEYGSSKDTTRLDAAKTERQQLINMAAGKQPKGTLVGEAAKFGENYKATVKPEPNVPGEQGTSKIAKSIESKAVAQHLTDTYGELAQYDKINIADQAKRSTDLVNNNIDQAKRIVNGQESLPSGLKATALVKAVEEHALKNGDSELLRSLSKSNLVSESSRSAQELRLAAERDTNSPIEAMKSVADAKAKAFERKNSSSLDSALDDTAKQIKSVIKAPTKQDWHSFVDSLKC